MTRRNFFQLTLSINDVAKNKVVRKTKSLLRFDEVDPPLLAPLYTQGAKHKQISQGAACQSPAAAAKAV